MKRKTEIEILGPPDGAVTEPLQRHAWPPEPEHAELGRGEPEAFDWRNLQILSPDRSHPEPVVLHWRKPSAGLGPLSYRIALGRSRNLHDARVIGPVGRCRTELWHLFIGARYYWKVTAYRFGSAVAESPVWSFTTNPSPPRWIRVPHITNVRDIGGWPLPGGGVIRQGLVYRSSEMNGSLHLTKTGRKLIEEELGVRTDLDLRGVGEASPALDPDRVRWIHIPISAYDSICDDAFKDGYRRIFGVFADPASYPIICHCVGGADRGGTVVFLLNALLGKSKEDLFLDYELTSLSIWGERSRLSEQFGALLQALAQFGPKGEGINQQVEAYVRSIGVDDGMIDRIRSRLIGKPNE